MIMPVIASWHRCRVRQFTSCHNLKHSVCRPSQGKTADDIQIAEYKRQRLEGYHSGCWLPWRAITSLPFSGWKTGFSLLYLG